MERLHISKLDWLLIDVREPDEPTKCPFCHAFLYCTAPNKTDDAGARYDGFVCEHCWRYYSRAEITSGSTHAQATTETVERLTESMRRQRADVDALFNE